MRRSLGVLVVFACLSAGSAQAAPIFSDNFNGENGGVGALNYAGFSNFAISGGTVDLIGNGYFDFFPGNGLYVDLDGSTAHAGLMSADPLSLGAGDYTLSFDLAGSQRGDTNVVTVNVFSSRTGHATNTHTRLQRSFSVDQTFSLSGPIAQFSFRNAGGDNVRRCSTTWSRSNGIARPRADVDASAEPVSSASSGASEHRVTSAFNDRPTAGVRVLHTRRRS